MKVVYNQYTPLDGAGTILSPAYKWRVDERTEFCDNLMKAGNLWYMMRGGYVYHSIEVEKITRIETDTAKASCSYDRREKHFPFFVDIKTQDGNFSVGADTFETIYNIILNN
jgi:hypothetical protein